MRAAPSSLSAEAHDLVCRGLRALRVGQLEDAHRDLRDACDLLEQRLLRGEGDPLYAAARTGLEALARIRTVEAQVMTIDGALRKERRRLGHDRQLALVCLFRSRT